MGKQSRLRAEKIAQVQRQRDIAEVFGSETMLDIIQRQFVTDEGYTYLSPEDFDVIIDGSRQYIAPDKPGDYFNVNTVEDSLGGDCFYLNWNSSPDETPLSGSYFVNFTGVCCDLLNKEFIKWAGVSFKDFLPIDNDSAIGVGVACFCKKSEDYPPERPLTCIMLQDKVSGNWSMQVGKNAGWDELNLGATLIYLALNIVCLLTKSNIELVDQPPNPRLSAISEREFGRPLTTYKVLKVNTGHTTYQGRDKDTGLKDFDPRRMHVVRGHHAEYGTNGRKLLFGKYEKKIWIPAHVRGNEELGIVVKDYEVVNQSLS